MKNGDMPSVVLIALSLLTLPNARGHLCHGTSSAGEGRTRLAFLREVPRGVTSLYLSIWSKDMQLIRCAINDDPVVTGDYLSFCHKTGIRGQANHRFNISVLLTPQSPCTLSSTAGLKFVKRTKKDVSDLSHRTSDVKTRRKRSWLFPGTLWCGTGTEASGYDQLGMFANADRCCREHDHCVNIIPPFSVNHGVFNPNVFTVSQCDCDHRLQRPHLPLEVCASLECLFRANRPYLKPCPLSLIFPMIKRGRGVLDRFRECLQGVNDTISSLVGYSFFNVLKVPCFEFVQRRQCVVKYWWGMCKVAKEAPYAVFQKPLAYKTSHSGHTTDSPKSTSHEGQSTSPSGKPSKSKKPKSCVPSHRCPSRGPPRGGSLQGKRRTGKGHDRRRKTSMTIATQTATTSVAHTAVPSSLTNAPKTRKTTLLKAESRTTQTVSKTNTTTSNTNTLGKNKGHRVKLTTVPPQATTKARRKTTPTSQSTPPVTQSTPPIAQSTAPNAHEIVKTRTATAKAGRKRGQKKHHHCGPRVLVRGDTFQPRREPCLDEETASLTPATITSTAKTTLPARVKTDQIQRPDKATVAQTEKTLASLWNTGPNVIHTRMKFRTETQTPSAALHVVVGKSAKQRNNSVPLDKTNLQHMTTDNMLLCGALQHLDECKHKIPPLETKYGLHNMESKTVYHCDCISRLAGQIEHFRKPTALASLLADFVSHYCFKQLNENDCHSRTSCAAGFSKASDLLQALKNIEGKDIAGMQNSAKDSKRPFPVRLYKRCLRIVEPKRS